jgi:hypothetical protein
MFTVRLDVRHWFSDEPSRFENLNRSVRNEQRVNKEKHMSIQRFLFGLALCIAAFSSTAGAIVAQSTDRDNPTPVTANVITSNGVDEKTDYYYSIPVGAGDLTVSLDVQAVKNAAVSSVDISLLNKTSDTLLATYANPDHGATKHTARTIKSNSAQTLLLVVEVSPGVDNFKITLDGALNLSDSIAIGGSAPAPVNLGDQPAAGGSTSDSPDFSSQTLNGKGDKLKTEDVYRVSVGPGELTLTLNVKSFGNAAVSSVDLELLNEKSQEIAAGFANPSFGASKQTVVTTKLTHKQTLMLKIIVSPGVDTYSLNITGPMNGLLHKDAPAN